MVTVHWPLYTLYPISVVFFYTSYCVLLPALCKRCLQKKYSQLSELNARCFLQNLNALLHTVVVVGSLFGVFSVESGVTGPDVMPHYSELMYADICVSLGYFSFVLPWSLDMYCRRGARPPYTGLDMILHHTTVMVAELAYVLTQYAAWHGAIALVLFEVTNWFFLPYMLLTQMEQGGSLPWLIFGVGFVLTFIGCRVAACTWLAYRFIADIVPFYQSAGDGRGGEGWLAVQLAAFLIMLLLSYWWFAVKVLPAVHVALKQRLGDAYHHACVPASVRSLAHSYLTEEGRQTRRERRERLRVLRELRVEGGATAGSAVATARKSSSPRAQQQQQQRKKGSPPTSSALEAQSQLDEGSTMSPGGSPRKVELELVDDGNSETSG